MTVPLTPEYLVAYFDAFSRSDFATMQTYYHDEIVLTFPGSAFGGVRRGKAHIVEMFRGVQYLFNGTLRFECVWAGVTDNRGIVQWFTHGYPRQGGYYRNRGCVLWTFVDRKIIDFQDYIDTEIISAFFPGGVPTPPAPNIDEITAKAFMPAKFERKREQLGGGLAARAGRSCEVRPYDSMACPVRKTT